jgi:hypothetical protein
MGNNLGSYSEYTFASPLSVMKWVIPGSYSGARLGQIPYYHISSRYPNCGKLVTPDTGINVADTRGDT